MFFHKMEIPKEVKDIVTGAERRILPFFFETKWGISHGINPVVEAIDIRNRIINENSIRSLHSNYSLDITIWAIALAIAILGQEGWLSAIWSFCMICGFLVSRAKSKKPTPRLEETWKSELNSIKDFHGLLEQGQNIFKDKGWRGSDFMNQNSELTTLIAKRIATDLAREILEMEATLEAEEDGLTVELRCRLYDLRRASIAKIKDEFKRTVGIFEKLGLTDGKFDQFFDDARKQM